MKKSEFFERLYSCVAECTPEPTERNYDYFTRVAKAQKQAEEKEILLGDKRGGANPVVWAIEFLSRPSTVIPTVLAQLCYIERAREYFEEKTQESLEKKMQDTNR